MIYCGAASGGLWKSVDGAKNWTSVNDSIMSMSLGISDIIVQKDNTNILYVATGDCDASSTYSIGVIKSTNGGSSWLKTGLYWNTSETKRIFKLVKYPSNNKIIYAAGTNGIDKTINSGQSWTNIKKDITFDIKIKPDDENTIYAAGNTFEFSTDGGDSWQQSNQQNQLPASKDVSRIAIAVTPFNPNNVYAVVANSANGFSGFYVSTDAGYNWKNQSNSPNLLGWMPTGMDEGGQGFYDLCIAVSPIDDSLIYIGGINVWKSTNLGRDWKLETNWYQYKDVTTVHADQHDLFFIPDNPTIFASNDGGVYRKLDGDSLWKWLGDGLSITQFYRLGCSETEDNMIIAGSQDNGTKIYDGTFTNVKGSDGMNCLIDFSNSNILYCSAYNGGIYISEDKGKNFKNIKPTSGTGSWVTPFLLNPVKPEILIAAFQDVYKTTNRGANWSVISNFAIPRNKALDYLAIAPSDENIIYTGTGNGKLNMTIDGGLNWDSLNYPDNLWLTSIAIHPTEPNRIWASFSGYKDGSKVFYSRDGGKNWQNITKGLPNAPANCIIFEKDSPDRLYLGTDIGVYVTDIYKNSWQKYSDGLPGVVVTELEIQYHTKKLRAATYGRGLWESDLLPTILQPVISGNFNNICISNTEIYKSNSFSGLKNKWVVSGGKIIGSSDLDSIIVNWTDTLNQKILLIQSLPNSGLSDSTYKFITVYSRPNPIITGIDTTCPNSTTTYGCNYNPIIKNKWYVTGGKIIGIDSAKSVAIQFDNNPVGKVILEQTNRENLCSDTISKLIIIKSIQKPEISGLNVVCSNSTSVYKSKSNFGLKNTWSVLNGIILNNYSDSIKVFWNDTLKGQISLMQSDNSTGCYDTTNYPVSVNKVPDGVLNGNFSVCTNKTEKYSANNNPDYLFKWKADNGIITGSDTLPNFDVNWSDTGTKKLSLHLINKNSGCSFDTTIDITIKSSPQPFISGENNLCKNSEGTYTINVFSGYSIFWSIKGGNIIGSMYDSVVKVNWPNAGLAIVKAVQTDLTTGCSDSTSFSVNVVQLPSALFSGADTVCPSCLETYKVLDSNMNNFWRIIGGIIQSAANEDSVKIFWGSEGKGKITLIQTDKLTNCMDSIFKNIDIINSNLPVISGNREVCSQAEEIYSTSTNKDYSNLWFVTNGIILGPDYLSNVKIRWGSGATSTLKLEQTNTNTSIKLIKQIDILINQKPVTPIISRVGFTLNSSVVSGNIWYIDDKTIAGVHTQQLLPDREGNYYVQVIDINNCLSDLSAKYVFKFSSVTENNDNKFYIYPNPAIDYLNIIFNEEPISDISVEIYDFLGNVIVYRKIDTDEKKIILPDNILSGVYLLALKINKNVYRKVFILDR